MLHRIEHSIQQFVESIFSAVRGNHPFTDLLMSKLQDFVSQADQNALSQSNTFTLEIHIHADKYDELMIHQSDRVDELLEMVKHFVVQAFPNTSTVEVKLMPDWSLDTEGLVITQQSEVSHDSTRRMERPIELLVAAAPYGYLLHTDHTVYEITQAIINIGRSKENDLVVKDLTVSRDHAQLRATAQQITLFDKGGKSGTYVNGKKIHQAVLASGDVLKMGQTEFVFQKNTPSEPTTSSFQMP